MGIIGKLQSTSTKGEKKLYNHLLRLLDQEKNLFCYYEPLIQDKYPDYLILGPNIGVVIIEVKDYLEQTLLSVSTSEEWIIRKNNREIAVGNPLNQVYNYWKGINTRIAVSIPQLDYQQLVQQVIVLPNILSTSPIGLEIQECKPSRITLFFKEDIYTVFSKFQQSYRQKIRQTLDLSSQQVKLLRGNLIPTSRLPSHTQIPLREYFSPQDQLRLLDLEQEQVARELGEGHRLIFGVAGSGKTILLIARARYLALKHRSWRILVLCYNTLLREYLKKLLNPANFEADVYVDSFHHWAKELLFAMGGASKIAYQQAQEQIQTSKDREIFFKATVAQLLLQSLEKNNIRLYDAVLIDEGQDFEKDWFIPIMKVLDPGKASLLIAVDGMQSVYKRKKFYWADVGIQARGRVKKFTQSYRNPVIIGKFAYSFLLKDKNIADMIETEDEYLATENFIRKGGTVIYEQARTTEEEYQYIIKHLHALQDKKWTILILFLQNLQKAKYKSRSKLFDLLDREQISWDFLSKGLKKTPGIYVGTLHGTKGLEADAVIIPHISQLSKMKVSRQLLYVGMTRALHYLVLTGTWDNEWTQDIKALLYQA